MKTRAIILSIHLVPCSATVGCDHDVDGDELHVDTYRATDFQFCDRYDGTEISIGVTGNEGPRYLTTDGEVVKAKPSPSGWTVHCDEDRVLLYRDTGTGRRWLRAQGPDVPVATAVNPYVPSTADVEWKAVLIEHESSERWRLESYSCDAGTLGVVHGFAVTISGQPDEATAVATELEIEPAV